MCSHCMFIAVLPELFSICMHTSFGRDGMCMHMHITFRIDIRRAISLAIMTEYAYECGPLFEQQAKQKQGEYMNTNIYSQAPIYVSAQAPWNTWAHCLDLRHQTTGAILTSLVNHQSGITQHLHEGARSLYNALCSPCPLPSNTLQNQKGTIGRESECRE